MAYTLPTLDGPEDLNKFIDAYNRRRRAAGHTGRIVITTKDVVNCYPSCDTAEAISRRKRFTERLRKRIRTRYPMGHAPQYVKTTIDTDGKYQASFTTKKPGEYSKQCTVFSLDRLLYLYVFLL